MRRASTSFRSVRITLWNGRCCGHLKRTSRHRSAPVLASRARAPRRGRTDRCTVRRCVRIGDERDEEQVVGCCAMPFLPPTSQCQLHSRDRPRPAAFTRLLARWATPLIRVNYNWATPLAAVRSARGVCCLRRAHRQRSREDRTRGRRYGRLGSGDTNFEVVFDGLARLRCAGDYVLQAARGSRVPRSRSPRGSASSRLLDSRSPMRILIAGLGGIGQRHVRNLRGLFGRELEILAYRG